MKKLFLMFAIVMGFAVAGCKNEPVEKPNGGGDIATPSAVLSVDRSTIHLGEMVTFSVTFEESDVTAQSVIYDSNDSALEGYTFTAEATGVYKFYAIYDGKHKSETLSVYVKGEDSLTFPEDHNPGNLAFHHRVVFIDHTGVNCGYCPLMIDNLIALDKTEWGDFYNEVTCHAGGMAVGDPANSESADIVNDFQSQYINGYPLLCINFHTACLENHSQGTFITKIGDILQGCVKREGANVGVAMSVDKGDNSILCSAQIKSAKYQEYRVNAWLLESNIYSPNQASAKKEEHYYYNHALRNTSEKLYSDDIAGLSIGHIEAGMTYDYDCEIAIEDASWVADNMEVLIVVSAKDNNGVWEVANTAHCPVGKSLPYRYVGEAESLGDAVYGSDDIGEATEQLPTPEITIKDITETSFMVEWGVIEGASLYTIMVNGVTYTTSETYYLFENFNRGDYRVLVKASGEGYKDSEYSDAKSVTLSGPLSVDWFSQSVALVEDNEQNFVNDINSSNAFTYTWQGEGVVSMKSLLFKASELPSSYEVILSELADVDAVVVEQVNSADGYKHSYTALEGGVTYTLCTLATNENGLQYLASSEITTSKTIVTPAVEAWLGTWSAYTEQVYSFDKGLRDEHREFTFTVKADEENSGYVWVDGLSAQGAGVPAYAKVTYGDNGEYVLGLLNGIVLEDYGGGILASWMANCYLYTYYDYDYDGKYDGEYDMVYESRTWMSDGYTSISLILSGESVSCKFHEDWMYEDTSYKVNFMDVVLFNTKSGEINFFTEPDGTKINEFRCGEYFDVTRVQ